MEAGCARPRQRLPESGCDSGSAMGVAGELKYSTRHGDICTCSSDLS
jgi:hypothetical protein